MESLVDARSRLQAWVDDVIVGRFERPVYKNPGQLKADVRVLLDYLDDAEQTAMEQRDRGE